MTFFSFTRFETQYNIKNIPAYYSVCLKFGTISMYYHCFLYYNQNAVKLSPKASATISFNIATIENVLVYALGNKTLIFALGNFLLNVYA